MSGNGVTKRRYEGQMKLLLALIGSLLLLAVTAFCVFGFMATFEPTNNPSQFMAFRIRQSWAVANVIRQRVKFQWALRDCNLLTIPGKKWPLPNRRRQMRRQRIFPTILCTN